MTLKTDKFIRKARPVDAALVTEDNLSEIAGWTGGLVVPTGQLGNDGEPYVHVAVRNPRRESDNQARPGMYVVREDFRTFRILTAKQFKNSYESLAKPKPSPSVMPKKQTVSRSAESGEFVSAEEAAANPSTTVTETVDVPQPKQVGAVEVVPGTPADEGSSLTTGTKKENDVDSDEYSGADEPASGDIQADELRDVEQPEVDEDGTVQLGQPENVELPALCGTCGSQAVDGVCSKDTDHNVFGQAGDEAQTAPRILPGN